MRRSTQMLILGLAVFAIGVGVVLVSLLGSEGGADEGAASTATTTTVQAGTVVINPAAPTAPTSFTIPPGKQAVAVQVPYVSGLAGYGKAGDVVNVYGNLDEKGVGADPAGPATRLILSGVEVLAVTGPGPGAETGNATYLLALDAAEAEQAIFFAKFQSLWMTLVPKGQAPSPRPAGHTYSNAF